MLPSGERRWCRLTSSPRKLADGSTVWEGFQIDSVSSFGQDNAGELYAVSHEGTIYRLTP